jgi:hypothetical protein
MSTASPFGPRRSRPARRNALLLALLATVSLSACGDDDEDGNQPAGAPETSAPSPSPATDGQETSPAEGTPIRITFGDTELTARLDDNATARDLAVQLPLTLTFRDHNNVEKTAPLPRELSLDGAPEGTIPPPATSATGRPTATSSSTTTATLRSSTASSGSASSTATWTRSSARARTSPSRSSRG